VPMLLGGDELGRTKGGNNNSYPLDQPNWYRWDEHPRSALVEKLSSLRRRWPELRSGDHHLVHDHPVAVVEVGRLLVICNPTGDDYRIPVPPTTRELLFDSSAPERSGEVAGGVAVPSWSVLVLGPAA